MNKEKRSTTQKNEEGRKQGKKGIKERNNKDTRKERNQET